MSGLEEDELLDCAALLEALRPQLNKVIGIQEGVADKPSDQPILDAWTKALNRYRKACAAYVAATP